MRYQPLTPSPEPIIIAQTIDVAPPVLTIDYKRYSAVTGALEPVSNAHKGCFPGEVLLYVPTQFKTGPSPAYAHLCKVVNEARNQCVLEFNSPA